MKWITVLLALLTLAGCATEPEVRYRTRVQQVEIPITQPCPVQIPPVERYATSYLTGLSTDYEKIRALVAERKQRAGMEADLRELLRACIAD